MFPSLQTKLKRYEELEQLLQDPEVLANIDKMLSLSREHGGLAKVAKPVREFNHLEEDIEAARMMIDEETDEESKDYAKQELNELLKRYEQLKLELEELVTSGDSITRGGLIMEIRAGTGGDEAALFARDLFDMYKRLTETRGWKCEVITFNGTELGGVKEVVLSISGDGAFHNLQFESGGHRVQRVPETEAQGRIHTSAATVAVLPEAEDIEIDIKTADLKIERSFASGPGGQKVNKTESAIRIVHIPTGIEAQCQDEKSQHKNKAKAMRVLRSRILEAKQAEAQQERADQRRTLIGSGDRSQRIRTYNFPQNRLTDHRVDGLTIYKLDQIMQGNLDELISRLIEFDRQERFKDGADEESDA